MMTGMDIPPTKAVSAMYEPVTCVIRLTSASFTAELSGASRGLLLIDH